MTKGNNNSPHGDGHVLDALSVYIDGALEAHEQEQVRAHITQCEDCRAEYLEMRATKQMLNALPPIAPPRAFTLTQEMVAPRTSFWQRIFTPSNAPRFATGSVLAFALLVLILMGDFGAAGRYSTNAPAAVAPVVMSDQRLAESTTTALSLYGIVVTQPTAMMQETAAAAGNIAQPAPGGSRPSSNEVAAATATTEEVTAVGALPPDLVDEFNATQRAQQTAESLVAMPMQGSRQKSAESDSALMPRSQSTQSDTDTPINSGRILLIALEVALALLAGGLMLGALLARKSKA